MMKRNIIKIGRKILREYGINWAFNRGLYSLKLKGLQYFPKTELLYEKEHGYPVRCDIFLINKKELENFLEKLSVEEKKDIIKNADNACVGKIHAFSAVDFDYGYPINWQMNPVTRQECSNKKKWFDIPDFDEKRGDIKFVWEISRFTHFLQLSRAYILTQNTKYYYAFSDQLQDWLDYNPYSYGANFKCGQECSFRMANVVIAYAVFHAYGKTNRRDEENTKELVYRSYKKILSNFFYAHKCIKNDHTFSELMGMIIGAWCTEDEKQLNYAYRILDEEIQKQFSEDGGYKSFSFNYERQVLQTLEFVYAISGKIHYKISNLSNNRLKKAVNLLYQCQDEKSGYLPNYGSNDGALIFPVSSCEFRDYRPIINSMSVLTTGSRVYAHGIYDEETLWFTGSINQKKKSIIKKSACFDKAGIFLLRNKEQMVFLVANNFNKRPGHMDQLHFDLWVEGKNIFCDSGSYSYVEDVGKTFTSTEAHNTVSIDGKTQMNEYSYFLVYDWTQRKSIRTDQCHLSASIRSKNGYFHKRQIRLKDNSIKLVDIISADVGDIFRVSFHTPFTVRKTVKEDIVEIYDNEKKICILKSERKWHIKECWISNAYGSKKQGTCVEINGKMNRRKEKLVTTILIGEK